jgi:ferredoxin
VLEAEIATITRLGIDLEMGERVGADPGLAGLRARFDAVLLACGATARQQAQGWGLPVTQRGVEVRPRTHQTSESAVFAAGCAVRGKAIAIRSVADGKEAAVAVDQFLSGLSVTGCSEPFSTKIGRMHGEELAHFAAEAAGTPRREPEAGRDVGLTPAEGALQAARCLHCDCRGLRSCKLRKYAAIYQAHPRRFQGQRRVFTHDARHAEIVYEPGKCIDCGLCIQIAAAAGERLGLAFVGRGFDVRVAVPLDRSLAEALTEAAAECVAACPTAALAWKRD